MENTKYLKCRFCGETAEVYRFQNGIYGVKCDGCRAIVSFVGRENSELEAYCAYGGRTLLHVFDCEGERKRKQECLKQLSLT